MYYKKEIKEGFWINQLKREKVKESSVVCPFVLQVSDWNKVRILED